MATAQTALGLNYREGLGVPKDVAEGVRWIRRAAEQGEKHAQFELGRYYILADGVPEEYVQAHKWLNLASAQGFERSKELLSRMDGQMTMEQIAEAQRLARESTPRKEPGFVSDSWPSSSGTGFFITDDGFLITNAHLARDAGQLRVITSVGIISAKVVRVDAANDLALLKADGKFTPLPVVSRGQSRWAARWSQLVSPTSACKGSRPSWLRVRSPRSLERRIIRDISRSAFHCNPVIQVAHSWMSTAT
jgi:hypothetical protein